VDRDIAFLIAEDQDIVSLGLKISLEEFSRLKLLGLAKDGEKAVEMALSLKPDVVIMDLGLPRLDGIQATAKICHAEPAIKILVMSSREKARDIFACFGVGASGFCRKESSAGEVYTAMQEIMDGQLAIEAKVAGQILAGWQELKSSTQLVQSDGKAFAFSEMELQIVALIADGLNNSAIAAKLGQSVDTLIEHKQKLKHSLSCLGSILVAQGDAC